MANPKPGTCVENPANPNNTGVVLDIPLFEGSGNPGDVGPNLYSPSLVGGATWTPSGPFGECLSLDGTGYISVPDAVPLRLASGNFTVAIGCQPSALSNFQNLLWKDSGTDANYYGILTAADGSVGWQSNLYGDVATGAGTLVNGVPARVVVTFASGAGLVTIYVNGVSRGSNSGLTGSDNSGGVLAFGKDYTNNRGWVGLLDGPVITSTTWTAAQAKQDYADWFARFRAISPIQSSTLSTATSTSSITASFGVLPTVGNAVIVHIWGYTFGGTTPTLFDNQSGNSYSEVVLNSDFIGNEYSGQWLLPAVVTSAGTFTVSASGTFTIVNMFLEEFNPGLTADQVNSANGSSSAPAAGAVTTSIADELIALTFGSLDASNPAVIAPPGGFYLDQQQLAGGLGGQIVGGGAYEAVSTTQSGINPTWGTDTSARWAAVVGTYKITSSPPPPPAVLATGWFGDELPYWRKPIQVMQVIPR